MSHRKYLIIAILLSTFSCKENDLDKNNYKSIDISKAYVRDDKIPLSYIADSISYVCLQTDSNCFIGNIRKPEKYIQFAEDRLFISDRNKLLSFKFNGKFITKIGAQGKGNGEFSRIDNFTLLKKQRLVLIYSAAQQSLLFYSFDNKFIKSVKIDFWPLQLSVLQDKYIVFGSGKGRRNLTNYFTLSVLDTQGKQLNQLVYREWEKYIEKNDKLGLGNIAQFYNFSDTLSYWEYQYNMIWRIPNQKNAFRAYYIELGENKFPIEYILESAKKKRKESDNFAHLWRFIETNRYFFFRVGYNKRLKHIFYDKQTKDLYNIHYENEDNDHHFAFFNDIDGGLAFWPQGYVGMNKVFSIVYGFEIKRKLLNNDINSFNQSDQKNKLFQMVENSNIMDNPILMIAYLRDQK